jgi:hypothetical protein
MRGKINAYFCRKVTAQVTAVFWIFLNWKFRKVIQTRQTLRGEKNLHIENTENLNSYFMLYYVFDGRTRANKTDKRLTMAPLLAVWPEGPQKKLLNN